MVDRQIRYNSYRSARSPHRVEWFFLVINDRRYIRETLTKINSTCAPIAEEYQGLEGVVHNTGLRYKLVHFECEKKVDNLWKIYKRMVRDSKLYEREDSRGLSNYIESLLNSTQT